RSHPATPFAMSGKTLQPFARKLKPALFATRTAREYAVIVVFKFCRLVPRRAPTKIADASPSSLRCRPWRFRGDRDRGNPDGKCRIIGAGFPLGGNERPSALIDIDQRAA